MARIERIDVLIVGAGPAGLSTALHLISEDRSWAERIIVLDKAVHPREKLCGGGVTGHGERVLERLGLSVETPHVAVREMRILYRKEIWPQREDLHFRVVRRDEFDHWLAKCGRRQGLDLRQGEAVKDVIVRRDHVEVMTERTVFEARVVIAADGSNSTVRRRLGWRRGAPLARLLEVLTPEDVRSEAFREGVAVFDFSLVDLGLQGYSWEFPSLIQGRGFMNRGVFDSRSRPERPPVKLKRIFQEALARSGKNLDHFRLQGQPIRIFDERESYSIPRVLLAGDAAGVDPLLGEGISFALGYGEVAAAATIEAFSRRDFSFSNYRQDVLSHPLLSKLATRAAVARWAYRWPRPWQMATLWHLMRLVTTVHEWSRRGMQAP